MKSRYGWVEIDHVRYDHDVIIHADGSVTKRSKKPSKKYKKQYGHTPLSHDELSFLEREAPQRIFIGTGQYGDLPITPEAQALLKNYESCIRPTPEILDLIEDEVHPLVAIIHVSC